MRFRWISHLPTRLFLPLIILLCITSLSRGQSTAPIYHVNRWVTGGICIAGGAASLLAYPGTFHKPALSDSDFTVLEKSAVGSFDRWALSQNILPDAHPYKLGAISTQIFFGIAPLALAFDQKMKNDRLDLFLMALEVNVVTLSIYQLSPLGPLFQNRLRPIVYYDSIPTDKRREGYNRNSFYSGHTASVAASTFFMAKVYSDYHPELGANKYFLFGAALIPPLIMGYIRLRELMHFPTDILAGIGVGALAGILIPEIHRLAGKSTSPAASGTKQAEWGFGVASQDGNWSFFLK